MAHNAAFAEFLRKAKRKIDEGGVIQIIVIGSLRSGKSLIALSLGKIFSEALGREFDLTHVTHEVADFLSLLNDEKRMGRGSVAILDEIQIQASSRRWYSDVNMAILAATQTFGNRGYIVIYTLPNLKGLDSGIVRLIDICVKTKGHPNRARHEAYGKLYFWEVNPETSKIKKKFPLRYEGIAKKKMKIIRFHLPPQDFIDAYVAKTDIYKRKVLKNAERVAREDSEMKMKHKVTDLSKIVRKVFADPAKYLQKWGGRTIAHRNLIAHDFGLSESQANKVRDLVRHEILRKGMESPRIGIGEAGGSP